LPPLRIYIKKKQQHRLLVKSRDEGRFDTACCLATPLILNDDRGHSNSPQEKPRYQTLLVDNKKGSLSRNEYLMHFNLKQAREQLA